MSNENTVIGWWSGGITSAVVCKLIIDLYGVENCRIIFIDTRNEHEDTYRFMLDCERWYGLKIEIITSKKYNSIQEVWYKYNALNNAKGAVCSAELKRVVRQKWEKENQYKHQAFGFDMSETQRAVSMTLNYGKTARPIYPLLFHGYTKKDCLKIVEDAGVKIPYAYMLGLNNNNCLKTGCVQGGAGYWQKIKRDLPQLYYKMGKVEHELTDRKGKPVTMLKDQSKEGKAKGKGKNLVFLIPHPDYPDYKDLSMLKGREPKPLMECNGFCGINDLSDKNETEQEINFEGQLSLFD